MSRAAARAVEGGLEVRIRLTPRSSRDALEGIETASDGRAHLKARVRAVPEDGKANAALVALVAKALAVPRSAVELTGGAGARLKTLRVRGDAAALEAALGRILTAKEDRA
ncbi:MAG: DUF167 domain-containing protein [Alphaproteobacteria bacterium]|nr:DUF167 domain-containing protein [Alphaproteobacteria bacterium]